MTEERFALSEVPNIYDWSTGRSPCFHGAGSSNHVIQVNVHQFPGHQKTVGPESS